MRHHEQLPASRPTLTEFPMPLFAAVASIVFGVASFAFGNPAGVPVFGLAFATAGFLREALGKKRRIGGDIGKLEAAVESAFRCCSLHGPQFGKSFLCH
jgi:hypothetical protein